MKLIPPLFFERLRNIIPASEYDSVAQTFSLPRTLSIRVNTIKSSAEEVKSFLQTAGIAYEPVHWNSEAFILKNILSRDVSDLSYFVEGKVYIQNLSSILTGQLINAQPDETILDLCSAPGSKSSQIAANMNNTGQLVCVEHVKERMYKLKNVLSLLGVNNAHCIWCDGRRYGKYFPDHAPIGKDTMYDRILVDAPCSSEGRFHQSNDKSFAYWSVRKIKEMQKKQRGLLLNASRWLKTEGVLVYSTCTFAPEENEEVVDWFLRKTKGAFIIDDVFAPVRTYPALLEWNKRKFDDSIEKCLRVLPTEMMDGFFITRFRRVKEL